MNVSRTAKIGAETVVEPKAIVYVNCYTVSVGSIVDLDWK